MKRWMVGLNMNSLHCTHKSFLFEMLCKKKKNYQILKGLHRNLKIIKGTKSSFRF